MLEREEYIEQAYFFRVLAERLRQNIPLQDLLEQTKEELLATTKLPLAIDFFLSELRHTGGVASAIERLQHYFTPFQAYLIREAEDEGGRFDMRIAVSVLRRMAEYLSGEPTRPGLFLYQFETLCRNRLSYDRGLRAAADDPLFNEHWKAWILTVRRQMGLVDFADLLYVRSALYARRAGGVPEEEVLFGEKEGKIAWANRRKDPLFLFAALQRQLNYPAVPRPEPIDPTPELIPQMLRRLERLETRIKLLEEEQKEGAVDLTRFYRPPEQS